MKSILVVDDSSTVRQMVSLTLQTEGYKITEASDGVEALDKAKSQQFDLVITDYNMPNMGGMDLCRNLKASEEYKFTPILVLTTESGEDKKTEGKEAKVSGWMVKPLQPQVLKNMVKVVLK